MRIFFSLEDQPRTDAVDVEAVLFDVRQFRLKLVVVDRLGAGNVNLEIDWFGATESIDR